MLHRLVITVTSPWSESKIRGDVVRGRIEKIWKNESRDGKAYWVLSIDGERYSVWDEDLMQGLEEGLTVAFDAKQSGDFNNITDIEVARLRRRLSSQKKVRLSCLRSASIVLANANLEPEKKEKLALEIAQRFERYVTDDQR